MCQNCSRSQKIVWASVALFVGIGAILITVAIVQAQQLKGLSFEVENQATSTVKYTKDNDHDDFILFIKASEKDNCNSIALATTVEDPHKAKVALWRTRCDIVVIPGSREDVLMSIHDPKLHQMGQFTINKDAGEKVHGDYTIKSSVPVWTLHRGDWNADQKKGLGASLLSLMMGIIFLVISCILCCVAGCCLKGSPQYRVGQPAFVGQMAVVGKESE